MARLLRILRRDEGATSVEYAVILALILAVVVVGISAFGTQTGGLWGGIDDKLEATEFGQQN